MTRKRADGKNTGKWKVEGTTVHLSGKIDTRRDDTRVSPWAKVEKRLVAFSGRKGVRAEEVR